MEELVSELDRQLSWPAIPARQNGVRDKRVWFLVAQRRLEVWIRILDIVTSVALSLLTLPLMMLVSILIGFGSPGPVLYRQVRVGLNGRHFVLFKFRSMVANAEGTSGPCWAQQGDSRVTRIGKFIRSTRIDELPQLANVLRGDMSMVGPRPERPHFADQLVTLIHGYQLRVTVKPGLTGWAQVNYPYGASVQDAREKLSYDLHYIKNKSLLLNIRILLATVPVVLLRRGAR
jgi:lipopolysaccharide/colanic/teichoic acid biosynthesis glycosyltransferase